MDTTNKSSNLVKLGGATSVVYIFAMLIWAWSQSNDLRTLKPNEFGDLLAGIFSPLAFLWLVLGYFQQGKELKASVKALELQGKELKNSVEQQRALVDVSTKQLEADFEARAEEEAVAEHQAQPRFHPSLMLNRMGGQNAFTFRFENHAVLCTDVVISVEGEDEATMERVPNGQRIAFQMNFDEMEELEALDGFIQYVDARGRFRRQTFTLNPAETHPGQPTAYQTAEIDRLILRPPWDGGD